jgi:hypothetical protein
MKTKVLAITLLLFGGLLFSSCQKDNALLEDTATDQTIMKDNNVPNESLINLRSYPEPFANCATIEYYIPRTSFVELFVYANDSEKIIRLVHGFQLKGDHKVVFNACNLPYTSYTAELRVNKAVHTITMNRDTNIDIIFPDIN